MCIYKIWRYQNGDDLLEQSNSSDKYAINDSDDDEVDVEFTREDTKGGKSRKNRGTDAADKESLLGTRSEGAKNSLLLDDAPKFRRKKQKVLSKAT